MLSLGFCLLVLFLALSVTLSSNSLARGILNRSQLKGGADGVVCSSFSPAKWRPNPQEFLNY